MRKIILDNGVEFEAIRAYEEYIQFEGAMRASVTIHLLDDALSLDVVDKAFGDASATEQIRFIHSETGAEHIFDGYITKVKVAREMMAETEPVESASPSRTMVVISMTRKTAQEIQNDKILEALSKLGLAL